MSTSSESSQGSPLVLMDFALNITPTYIPTLEEGLADARKSFQAEPVQADAGRPVQTCPFSPDFSVLLPRKVLEQIFDELSSALQTKRYPSAADYYVSRVTAVNRISMLSKDWRTFGQEKLFRNISWMEAGPHSPWGKAVRRRVREQPHIASLVRSLDICSTGGILADFAADFAAKCPHITKLTLAGLNWFNVTDTLRALQGAVFESLEEFVSYPLTQNGSSLLQPEGSDPPSAIACLLNFPKLKRLDAWGALAIYPYDKLSRDITTKLPLQLLHLKPYFDDAYPWNHARPNTTTFLPEVVEREKLRELEIWANSDEVELLEWLKQPGFHLVKLKITSWDLPVCDLLTHVAELLPFHPILEKLELELGEHNVVQRSPLFSPEDTTSLAFLLRDIPSSLIQFSFTFHLDYKLPTRPPAPLFDFLTTRLSREEPLEALW